MFPSARIFRGLLMRLCTGFVAVFSAGLEAAPPPIEAYAALPRVSDAVLSPDGDRVAVLQNDPDGTSRLVIANIKTGRLIRSVETRAYTDFERRDRIESITWMDEDRVGYVVNANRPLDRVYSWEAATIPWEALPFRRLTVLNLQTGKSELVFQGGFDDFFLEVAHVVSPVEGDPGFGRVTLPQRGVGSAFMSAYRVNLQTGKVGERLVEGEEFTASFGFNFAGDAVLRLDVDPVAREWQVLSLGSPNNHRIASGRDRDIAPTSIGLLGDGHVALATRFADSDRAELRAFTRSGSAVGALVTDPDHDVAALIHDPWSRTVIGATWEAAVHQQKFFDPDLAAVRATLEKRFPQNYLRVGSWAKNRSQVVVHLEKPGSSGAVYLFEPSSSGLTLLGEKHPTLNDQAATGRRLSTHYPARDGRRIPAILTLPEDGTTKARPLVILLEGYPFNATRMLRAPWALQADMPNYYPRLRADSSFYWLPAYLASRGFAVLEPAIRGTRGFGGRAEDAGDGQWAHGGVDDVEDAAHALVKAGIVDATQICTLGLQEAGHVALLAAARSATPVTCSIAVNSPLDLPAHWDSLQRIAWKHDWYRREFEERLGDDLRNSKSMRAVSPAHLAATIQGPVLIVGGNTTPWLTRGQARRMVKALDKEGKQVTYADLETADHFLEEPSTRKRFLVALDKFITDL